MARRHDTDKVLGELGEVRRALDDPATGLAAFHQGQDELRRKVLETVALGTAGLREENRELRRRQEKMLGDLADARTSLEALRRELAQAWTHVVGVSRPQPATVGVAAFELSRAAQPVEAGSDSEGAGGWEEKTVHELTDAGPAEQGDWDDARQPRASASELEGQASAAPPEAGPETAPGGAADASALPSDEEEEVLRAETRRYVESLTFAASIASARLVCHRDAWEFLIEQTAQHPHFRIPDRISDAGDGQIETFLSGRSLLAVLTTMRELRNDHSHDMATWALASAVYRRTQDAVRAATPHQDDGSPVTTIILDDRPAPVTTT